MTRATQLDLCNAFCNRSDEIASRFDRGDIDENHLFVEMVPEIIKQATSLTLRVLAAVADKKCPSLWFPQPKVEALFDCTCEIDAETAVSESLLPHVIPKG